MSGYEQLHQGHANKRGDIEAITDESGNVVAEFHYGPWGNLMTATTHDAECTASCDKLAKYQEAARELETILNSPFGEILVIDGRGVIRRINKVGETNYGVTSRK